MSSETVKINWSCRHTWKKSAKNTAWCVLGCSVGDFGTILYFQITQLDFPVLNIMILAIINGLVTSIALETFILIRQNFRFNNAIKTAFGMSFLSMIAMEISMNLTDYLVIFGTVAGNFALSVVLLAVWDRIR